MTQETFDRYTTLIEQKYRLESLSAIVRSKHGDRWDGLAVYVKNPKTLEDCPHIDLNLTSEEVVAIRQMIGTYLQGRIEETTKEMEAL